MARVNIDILGISELKLTGMGEFNSDDHCIYYCGQESLRRNGVAIMVNKRVQNAVQQKQDQELTVAQIMNSLLPNWDWNWRKWRKPLAFRYDLNQIPYDYTVEVRNRFKGLDRIDRVPEELWTEVRDTVEEAVIKTIPKKKEMQKRKMVVWGGLIKSW